MNATTDSDDLDFTLIFEGAAKAPPSLEAASEARKKEVKEGAVKLQQAGYCINIVRPATKRVPLAPGAKYHILCIDDDVPLLRILARKLTFDGYEVRAAYDRQTIVAELQNLPSPDLVLLDVGLPGINGFDLLQKLRAHPKLGSVPVIMLTGRVSLWSRRLCVQTFPVRHAGHRYQDGSRNAMTACRSCARCSQASRTS
jgi:CheY-like chemotaxis protein